MIDELTVKQPVILCWYGNLLGKFCWYGKLSNYLKPYHVPLQLRDNSTETAIFIATKHEKANIAVIQTLMIISFTFIFSPGI